MKPTEGTQCLREYLVTFRFDYPGEGPKFVEAPWFGLSHAEVYASALNRLGKMMIPGDIVSLVDRGWAKRPALAPVVQLVPKVDHASREGTSASPHAQH